MFKLRLSVLVVALFCFTPFLLAQDEEVEFDSVQISFATPKPIAVFNLHLIEPTLSLKGQEDIVDNYIGTLAGEENSDFETYKYYYRKSRLNFWGFFGRSVNQPNQKSKFFGFYGDWLQKKPKGRAFVGVGLGYSKYSFFVNSEKTNINDSVRAIITGNGTEIKGNVSINWVRDSRFINSLYWRFGAINKSQSIQDAFFDVNETRTLLYTEIESDVNYNKKARGFGRTKVTGYFQYQADGSSERVDRLTGNIFEQEINYDETMWSAQIEQNLLSQPLGGGVALGLDVLGGYRHWEQGMLDLLRYGGNLCLYYTYNEMLKLQVLNEFKPGSKDKKHNSLTWWLGLNGIEVYRAITQF